MVGEHGADPVPAMHADDEHPADPVPTMRADDDLHGPFKVKYPKQGEAVITGPHYLLSLRANKTKDFKDIAKRAKNLLQSGDLKNKNELREWVAKAIGSNSCSA